MHVCDENHFDRDVEIVTLYLLTTAVLFLVGSSPDEYQQFPKQHPEHFRRAERLDVLIERQFRWRPGAIDAAINTDAV